MNKTYLFNTTILTGGSGVYSLKLSTKEEFKILWNNAEYPVSAIGHEATAKLFSLILEEDIPVSRIPASQQIGDIALVLKMNGRIPEGSVITSLEELEKIGYELYTLEKIS